jgi:hypothetical protein
MGVYYCHVMECLYMGFGLVIRFIEILQLVITSKDYALTVKYTS